MKKSQRGRRLTRAWDFALWHHWLNRVFGQPVKLPKIWLEVK